MACSTKKYYYVLIMLQLVVAALLVLRAADHVAAAISCGSVASSLSSCLPYLEGKVASPPGGCCSGVKSLYSATAGSRPDRVTACSCLKSQASALGSNLKSGNAASLPSSCGISLGYPISTSTNCNSIP